MDSEPTGTDPFSVPVTLGLSVNVLPSGPYHLSGFIPLSNGFQSFTDGLHLLPNGLPYATTDQPMVVSVTAPPNLEGPLSFTSDPYSPPGQPNPPLCLALNGGPVHVELPSCPAGTQPYQVTMQSDASQLGLVPAALLRVRLLDEATGATSFLQSCPRVAHLNGPCVVGISWILSLERRTSGTRRWWCHFRPCRLVPSRSRSRTDERRDPASSDHS